MNNFERYLVLVSLSFFFSFMVLGLISINSALVRKDKMYNDLVVKNVTRKLEDTYKENSKCYAEEALDAYLVDRGQKDKMVRFLTASLSEGQPVDIYLNGQPDGNGAFFMMRMDTNGKKRGCVIAEGVGMKIALPPPPPQSPPSGVLNLNEPPPPPAAEPPKKGVMVQHPDGSMGFEFNEPEKAGQK